MPTNITLDSQNVLTVISNTDASTAIIRRLANSTGEVRSSSDVEFIEVQLNANASMSVGPFSETRRYVIDNIVGDISHTVNNVQINYNNISTGIWSGGALSINSGNSALIDIATGSGVILDSYTNPENPIVTRITWPAFTGEAIEFLATNFTSYLAIDRGGNLVQFTGVISEVRRRDIIILGLVVHTGNTIIENVSQSVSIGYDLGSVVHDFAGAVGIVNMSGNVFQANGSNLSIDKTVGKAFRVGGNFSNSVKSPNIVTSAALSAPNLFKPYQDGSGGFKLDFPLNAVVDPTKYDDGSGTLASVISSNWQILRIYTDPVNDNVIVHYGQNLYNTLARALENINLEDFNKNPVLEDAILRSFLLVRGNCTDLSDTTKAVFLAADKFGQTVANGSQLSLNAGSLEFTQMSQSSSFIALPSNVYSVDNTGGAITITLPENETGMSGVMTEFWIHGVTTTNNIIFKAFDFDHKINGVIGSDPDLATGTINSTTVTYLKVVVRYCNAKEYLIDNIDTVTV